MTNLYERAAFSGLYFGLYLTVLFFVNAYTQTVPLLGLVGLLLMLGVPFVVYRLLAKSYRLTEFKATYSELWLEGIVTFFFATLIVSAVSVIFMTWIYPGWLVDQFHIAIAQGEASDLPQLQNMAAILSEALAQHMLPSPIQLTLDMAWLVLFSGSMLSMLLAWVVRLRNTK